MVYVIISLNDKRVLHISSTLDFQENGNYLINDGTLAIPPSICELVEVDSVPEGVEPEKWLYKDVKFVPNPDWQEPVPEGDTNADIEELLTEMEAILNA